jgi:hypothetical protein
MANQKLSRENEDFWKLYTCHSETPRMCKDFSEISGETKKIGNWLTFGK